MEINYSKRELDQRFVAHEELDQQRFDAISEKMDAHFDAHTAVLKEIREQTIKTNGTVGRHHWLIGMAVGAIPLLSVWAGWLTMEVLEGQKSISPLEQAAIEASVYKGLLNAAKEYDE